MKEKYDNSAPKSRIQVAVIITDGPDTRMAKLLLNKEMLADSYREEGFAKMRARIRQGLASENEWAVNEVCNLLPFIGHPVAIPEKKSWWRRAFGG